MFYLQSEESRRNTLERMLTPDEAQLTQTVKTNVEKKSEVKKSRKMFSRPFKLPNLFWKKTWSRLLNFFAWSRFANPAIHARVAESE